MEYGNPLVGTDIRQGVVRGGKSYTAFCDLLDRLFEGGVIGTNNHMEFDWHYKAALLHPKYDGTIEIQDRIAFALSKRAYLVGSPLTLEQFGSAVALNAIGKAKGTEHAGAVMLDEAWAFMPPLEWRANLEWLAQFAMAGKNGFDIVLITHDMSMIDSKVRKHMFSESKVLKLKDYKIPVLGIQYPDQITDCVGQSSLPAFLLIRRLKVSTSKMFCWYRFNSVIGSMYKTKEKFNPDTLPSSLEPQSMFVMKREIVSMPDKPAFERFKAPGKDAWWLNLLDAPDYSPCSDSEIQQAAAAFAGRAGAGFRRGRGGRALRQANKLRAYPDSARDVVHNIPCARQELAL